MLDTSANTARRLTGSVATHDKGEQCLEIELIQKNAYDVFFPEVGVVNTVHFVVPSGNEKMLRDSSIFPFKRLCFWSVPTEALKA